MHFAKWERVMAYVVCLGFYFSITPVRFVEHELVSRYPEDRQHVKLRSKALQKEILANWRKASELPANRMIASANEL